MSVIVIGGMIATGKTSASEIIAEALGSEVFYEPVEDNPYLENFYSSSPKVKVEKRYPLLLQLYFLGMRFSLIKEAFHNSNNVLDRSIYEDWYFAKVNNEIGDISDEEFFIYEKLLNEMMQEVESLPQKEPDLMVYLHGSFDLVMDRIALRGRDFEQDKSLIDYYYKLWEGYDDWVDNHYDASDVLKINVDKLDFVHIKEDRDYLVKKVKDKLYEHTMNKNNEVRLAIEA